MKRILVLAVLVVGTMVMLGVPAWAWVTKSGHTDCGFNNVAIRSESVGRTQHWANGNKVEDYPGTGDWMVRNTYTSYLSASWEVRAEDKLSSSGTYGWCWGNR
jgi:hypothetical protein